MSERGSDDRVSDLLMASTHLRERREARLAVAVAISVSGVDTQGRVFHEQTLTTDVSTWGCGFQISVELKVNAIVALRAIPSEKRASGAIKQSLFQVVRVAGEANGWLVGVWKVDSDNFWSAEVDEMIKREERAQEASREAIEQSGVQQRTDGDQ
jgi:hypothetical protein